MFENSNHVLIIRVQCSTTNAVNVLYRYVKHESSLCLIGVFVSMPLENWIECNLCVIWNSSFKKLSHEFKIKFWHIEIDERRMIYIYVPIDWIDRKLIDVTWQNSSLVRTSCFFFYASSSSHTSSWCFERASERASKRSNMPIGKAKKWSNRMISFQRKHINCRTKWLKPLVIEPHVKYIRAHAHAFAHLKNILSWTMQ